MKRLADCLMKLRARGLLERLRPHLPASGVIADIGSGTGHNAELIRQRTNLDVREFDVVDLHWVGPGPQIIDGPRLPICDDAFDGLVMAFVLQYPDSPRALLEECRRVSRGPLLVVQSTYNGRWGRIVLAIREFVWGRFALRMALIFGIVRPGRCSLRPCQFYTRDELTRLFSDVGLVVVESKSAEWRGLGVSRDLFVLERKRP